MCFYILIATDGYCWQHFHHAHDTHYVDLNNRITLNKPSYALCFLLWRHYFYWENTHHVESSHRITNLSPRNVDYTIIKLLRLIFTKTGMCSVALRTRWIFRYADILLWTSCIKCRKIQRTNCHQQLETKMYLSTNLYLEVKRR